jgi:uncharacterized protein YbjT (DUF2867 family)
MSALLLGATGKIGPHVVSSLQARGIVPRVFARDVDHARTVLPQATEIVGGSYEDDLEAALDDAESILVLTEHGSGMSEKQIGIISKVRNSETRIVKISGTSVVIRPDGPEAGRQHWEIEQHLHKSANPWVIIRPNGFMQTLVQAIAIGARSGVVADPIAGAALSLVDAADVGEVTALALIDPSFDGQTLVLTGPTAVTYRDIAEDLGRAGGASAKVRVVPTSAAGDAVLARGGSEWEAHHLTEMMEIFRTGKSAYVTDDIERTLGRPAHSIADFIAREREVLFSGEGARTASATGSKTTSA